MTDADLGESVLNVSPSNTSNPAVAFNTFGEQVRERRRLCQLTQDKLAVLCGMPQGQLSRVERSSNVGLTARTMQRIAAALDCDLKIVLVPKNLGSKLPLKLPLANARLFGNDTTEQSEAVVREWLIITTQKTASTKTPARPRDIRLSRSKAVPQTGPMELRERPKHRCRARTYTGVNMTDIEQALSEIKRRAERTDLWIWNEDRRAVVKCICIREDALREALKEVYGDDSVLDPEPSQHTP